MAVQIMKAHRPLFAWGDQGVGTMEEMSAILGGYVAYCGNLLRAIDGLPAFYAVGIVCMLINRESRRLGDLVAGTVVVVHERSASGPIASWITEPRADAGRPIGPDARRVSLAEPAVIETFLARRLDLDPAVQARAEAHIVARVTARTGLSPASDQPGVEFLKQIARKARDPTRAREGSRTSGIPWHS